MTTPRLRPGTTVRSRMTGHCGRIRAWDPKTRSYVVRWDNYDFNIPCRRVHFDVVHG